MSFIDPAFIFCFLPLAILLFAIAGRLFGQAGSYLTLIAATIVFCIPYGWPFVLLLVGTAIANQLAVEFLVRDSASSLAQRRNLVFVAALAFNFAILCIVKYGILFQAVPWAASIVAVMAAAVPVTVSFFTFQRAVMLLDAFQRRPGTETISDGTGVARMRYGVFNLMFANLVIGPIAYVSEIGPQLASKRFGRLRLLDLEVGLTLFVIGLAKKVLIADPLSTTVVAPIFTAAEAGQNLVPLEVLVGMLGYYAQLYFDFSGYSDMALGIARMFGIRLPFNFNSPLRSTGIVDFYKRWHITLTRVIARFMFTPLSVAGTRLAIKRNLRGWQAKALSVWFPILVNFFVIGIWHGASMTFVVFGFYHGLWFILETEIRATKRWKTFAKRTSPRLRLRLGQMLTFAPMVISFSLFKSSSVSSFSHLLGSLGNDWFGVFFDASDRVLSTKWPLIYLVVAFSIIWLMPNAYEFMRRYRPGITTFAVPSNTPLSMQLVWRPTLIWGIPAAVLALCTIGYLNAPAPFVYGGF